MAPDSSLSQLFTGNFHTRNPAPGLTQKARRKRCPLRPWGRTAGSTAQCTSARKATIDRCKSNLPMTPYKVFPGTIASNSASPHLPICPLRVTSARKGRKGKEQPSQVAGTLIIPYDSVPQRLPRHRHDISFKLSLISLYR